MPGTMGLLAKPALGENERVLRPYQSEAVSAVRGEFSKGVKRTAIVMATGTGKSTVAGQIARHAIEKGNRTLILCPTRHLVTQMANTLDEMGVQPGVEMAEQRARELFETDVVIATTATMHPKRLAEWDNEYFKLIIVDECHHSTGESVRRVLRYFSKARTCGMTATLDRADEQDLGQIYESVAYEFNLWSAMTAPHPGPYLSRLTFVQCAVDIDLRELRTKDGDFTDADLEARIAPIIDVLANAIRTEAEERPTLVFTPMIKSAQGMATALQSLGVKADWISGDDPDRNKKIKRYTDGDLQMLCNVQLLTEGVDLPRTAAIALCRPTKSRPLFAQVVGRGTRLFDGKEDCRIIDFNYLTAKHKLVKPVELCDASNVDQEVLDIAQELMSKDKNLSLVDAVQEAEKEHKERSVLRIKVTERKLSYKRVSYDPLSVCDAIGMPWRGSRAKDSVVKRATPRQVELLQKFKVQDAPNLSQERARTLLDYLFSRAKKNLASPAQVSHMISEGIAPDVARSMSKSAASETLSNIWGTNGQRIQTRRSG